MGSSNKRKPSDVTYVGGPGNLGGSSTNNQNQCPLEFTVTLPNSSKLKDGQGVEIKTNSDNSVSVCIGLIHLYKIEGKKGERLSTCYKLGYRYKGKVKKMKDKYLAVFYAST